MLSEILRDSYMNAKSKRVRSPAYPAVSVKVALKKAEEFYKVEGRNEAFLTVALSHWGYSPTSGNGLKLVAALSSYGLTVVSGSGKNRKLKLSDLALRILLDNRESSSEKTQAIQSVALKPKIHQKLWNLWKGNLPSSANMSHHLIFDEGFNEKFVGSFVKDYIETIEFAGLANSSIDCDSQVEEPEEDIGSDDEFFEEENEQASAKTTSTVSPPVNLASEEVEIAKYPVAKDRTIRVIGNGKIGRKGIEALVAQLNLNLQLGIFDDEAELEE